MKETTPLINQTPCDDIEMQQTESIAFQTQQKMLTLGRSGALVLPYSESSVVNGAIKTISNSTVALILLYSCSIWFMITLILFVVINMTGCLIIDGNKYSFGNIMATLMGLAAQVLTGYGPNMSHDGLCSGAFFLFSICQFFFNMACIGLVVSKLRTPHPAGQLSKYAIVKLRNGQLLFQCRFYCPLGHYMSDMSVKMVSVINTISYEGENYSEVKYLNAQTLHRGGSVATNCSHVIDKSSPLYGVDLNNFSGYIEVVVSGYDTFLGVHHSETIRYPPSNIKIGYDFDNCYTVSPSEAMERGQKIVIDASKFSNIVGVPEKYRIAALESLRKSVNQVRLGHAFKKTVAEVRQRPKRSRNNSAGDTANDVMGEETK